MTKVLGIIGKLSGRVGLHVHEVPKICGSLFAMLALVIVHIIICTLDIPHTALTVVSQASTCGGSY